MLVREIKIKHKRKRKRRGHFVKNRKKISDSIFSSTHQHMARVLRNRNYSRKGFPLCCFSKESKLHAFSLRRYRLLAWNLQPPTAQNLPTFFLLHILLFIRWNVHRKNIKEKQKRKKKPIYTPTKVLCLFKKFFFLPLEWLGGGGSTIEVECETRE